MRGRGTAPCELGAVPTCHDALRYQDHTFGLSCPGHVANDATLVALGHGRQNVSELWGATCRAQFPDRPAAGRDPQVLCRLRLSECGLRGLHSRDDDPHRFRNGIAWPSGKGASPPTPGARRRAARAGTRAER